MQSSILKLQYQKYFSGEVCLFWSDLTFIKTGLRMCSSFKNALDMFSDNIAPFFSTGAYRNTITSLQRTRMISMTEE